MTVLRTLRVLKSAAGTVALEYGIILPMFLLMIIGGMDAGRLIWTYVTLQRSVEAAARCGAINYNSAYPTTICRSPGEIATRAVSEAYGLSVTAGEFTVTNASCGLRVTANHTVQLLTPWIGTSPLGPSNAITLSVSACYPT